jgi:hypothetical protein
MLGGIIAGIRKVSGIVSGLTTQLVNSGAARLTDASGNYLKIT